MCLLSAGRRSLQAGRAWKRLSEHAGRCASAERRVVGLTEARGGRAIHQAVLAAKGAPCGPILLVGTKRDLQQRELNGGDGVRAAAAMGVPYYETSAKSMSTEGAFYAIGELVPAGCAANACLNDRVRDRAAREWREYRGRQARSKT